MKKRHVDKKIIAGLIVDPDNPNSVQNWANLAFALGLSDFVEQAEKCGFVPGSPTASGQLSMENFKKDHPYIELIIDPDETQSSITFRVKRWGGGTGYDDLLAQFTCPNKCIKYLAELNKWKEIFFNK